MNGTGIPSSSLGTNGDFYLNLANGDVYNKISGAWAKVMNIEGETSPQELEKLEYVSAYASGTVVYLGRSCYQVSIQLKNTGASNVTINDIFLNSQPYNSTLPASQVPGGILGYQTGIVSVMLQPGQSLGGFIYLPVGSLWTQGGYVQIEISTTTGRRYPDVVLLP